MPTSAAISANTARDLLLYMLWADRHTLRALRGVQIEHLTRDAGVSFGSLLGTLVHTLSSERRWLARFAGIADPAPLKLEDFPDLLTWIVAWEESAANVEAFLASISDEQLAVPLTWTTGQGEQITRPLWETVLHLVNHGTYHRGQVVSLLRQMGYPPPSTDLIAFFHERAVTG
jgi:uncharacterized damage-inducible protein DinB